MANLKIQFNLNKEEVEWSDLSLEFDPFEITEKKTEQLESSITTVIQQLIKLSKLIKAVNAPTEEEQAAHEAFLDYVADRISACSDKSKLQRA